MTFLAKLGAILVKGAEILIGFGPTAQMLSPQNAPTITRVTSDLQQFEQAVITAEAVGQALGIPGVEKFKAAAPLISQLVLQSAFMAGKKIKDPAKFNAACAAIGGSVADLLNAVEADIKTEDKT